MPGTARRKDQRPQEITEAAFTEFAENGYADAKLDAVAQRAGVSKALVLVYFKSKQALFKAVVRAAIMPRLKKLDSALDDYEGSASEFLRGPLIDTGCKMIKGPMKPILRLLIAEGPKHPDLTKFYHQEVVAKGLHLLGRLIERGEQAGEFRRTELATTPQIIVAPMIMTAIWQILFQKHAPLDAEQVLRVHMDLLLAGLRPQGEDA